MLKGRQGHQLFTQRPAREGGAAQRALPRRSRRCGGHKSCPVRGHWQSTPSARMRTGGLSTLLGAPPRRSGIQRPKRSPLGGRWCLESGGSSQRLEETQGSIRWGRIGSHRGCPQGDGSHRSLQGRDFQRGCCGRQGPVCRRLHDGNRCRGISNICGPKDTYYIGCRSTIIVRPKDTHYIGVS